MGNPKLILMWYYKKKLYNLTYPKLSNQKITSKNPKYYSMGTNLYDYYPILYPLFHISYMQRLLIISPTVNNMLLGILRLRYIVCTVPTKYKFKNIGRKLIINARYSPKYSIISQLI